MYSVCLLWWEIANAVLNMRGPTHQHYKQILQAAAKKLLKAPLADLPKDRSIGLSEPTPKPHKLTWA